VNPITNRGQGIWQVKVPLPFPLLWVNSYVVFGKDGITVIDPGLHTAEAETRWAEAAEAIGFAWTEVTQILLTHHHPDHYGLAGWMQERTNAPVLMSNAALCQAQTLWGAEQAAATAADTLSLFVRHGFPATWIPAMQEHMESFTAYVSPQPVRFEIIAYGAAVTIGDAVYEALHTPGHAGGHISFYNAASGRLFCGDHVLPGITPNVSLLPFGDEDPLRTYLASLDAAESLAVTEAYPGHREPFTHYNERIKTIQAHHEERLQRMESLVETPATGYEVCRALFGDKLSMHQLRFALSETLAHLVYLVKQQRLASRMEGDIICFHTVR
jgi:glyoxylase-like metal-dependent hydrolase (beta-lactamase superfamily II)